MAIPGTTRVTNLRNMCHDSREIMRWQLWGPHTDGNSGEHVQSEIISRKIIPGKHKRWNLWRQ
jgi:hypothetical protein